MPRGRPTKYSAKIQAKAEKYLASGYEEEGHVVPSIVGLASYLGLATSTVELWASQEDKPDFSGITGGVKQKQHNLLFANGLTGDFNPNIAKLMLTKHGYTDKQDINSENTHRVEIQEVRRTFVDADAGD